MGDVTTLHADGGMGLSQYKKDRIHLKIGPCEGLSSGEIKMITDSAQAKNLLLRGKLLDAVTQHFEEFDTAKGEKPVPVYVVTPELDTPGSVDAPVAGDANTGSAALPTTAGTPTGDRTVILKITKSGEHGVAEYRKSTDGGETFGAPLVTPASGSPISLDVGVTATFVDDAVAADTFKVGDTFQFTIHGPTASTASYLTLLENLKEEYAAYWWHIVKDADRAFAVSVATVLASMELDYHLPIRCVLQAPRYSTGSVTDFYKSQVDEFDPLVQARIAVVIGEARYIPGGIERSGGVEAVLSNPSLGEWRNPAAFLCARMAAHGTHMSPAWVGGNRSLTFANIRHWKEGYRGYLNAFQVSGLTALKVYDDYPGVYLQSGRLMGAPSSDFQEIPEGRIVDKIHRIARQASLPHLDASSDVESGSGGLDAVEADIRSAITSEMQPPGAREIVDFDVTLDPNGTYVSTGKLEATLSVKVAQRNKEIVWTTVLGISGGKA